MPIDPQLGAGNEPDDSFPASRQPDLITKLLPIVFGLVVGMLIMLLVIHFLPQQSKQESTEAAAPVEESPSASALPAADLNQTAPSSGQFEVTVTSRTASGYPVVISGPSRAVDFQAPQGSAIINNDQPTYAPLEGASLNPCVDPPSAMGRAYRSVDR